MVAALNILVVWKLRLNRVTKSKYFPPHDNGFDE